ncbi:MAG TPA: trypsin-like peptidase domain-containing protein [Acidimicrobiales bacterium]|nr:trypsin-like peptidase domain-containing protein [Acidimicrobiales bacterium]
MSGPPEQPENGEPGRDEGGADPDEPEARLRGWIDPDDRLWRHPSEQVPVVRGGPVLSPPAKHRYRGPLMILIGAASVAAVGAFVAVLLSPSSQPPLASTGHDATSAATLTTLTGPERGVPSAAQTAAKSMVELRATTAHGTVTLIGVAVADGGLVVTTASLLSDVRSISMVGSGGKLERASIVGTDAASDIALVDVPEDVPLAPFSDDGSLAGGAPDTVLSLVASGGGRAGALHATSGAITGVATNIASGPANGMAAITSAPAMVAEAAGDPLLDASGFVVGILCDPQSPTTSAATFLPTQLVVGVADDLRSGSRVVPGWLGVAGSDVAGGGAKVASIYAGSPAAGHLQVGEVIVAVNAQPVRTFAELRSRLYVLSPGATAKVSVQGAPGTAGIKVVSVTLSRSS